MYGTSIVWCIHGVCVLSHICDIAFAMYGTEGDCPYKHQIFMAIYGGASQPTCYEPSALGPYMVRQLSGPSTHQAPKAIVAGAFVQLYMDQAR